MTVPFHRSPSDLSSADFLSMTTDIVSQYVSNNAVEMAELPKLIRQIHICLGELGAPAAAPMDRPEPAVPVKKSIHDDYLICLEDGKKFKMLKRHLKTTFNLTPEQYRERWNLGPDYPMVAPNYAKRRSNLAVKIGLGRKGKATAEAA